MPQTLQDIIFILLVVLCLVAFVRGALALMDRRANSAAPRDAQRTTGS